ncbi:thermonuclease family protein [Rhodobacter sp. JA431]|uniref:thermonuclease family protein n=1 Tax=Rhodobacter sp. JA431 TaxID=570013 RepID=UPI00201668A2|nr:thermonuclease family protein [Rhodobacter sp. JA431]
MRRLVRILIGSQKPRRKTLPHRAQAVDARASASKITAVSVQTTEICFEAVSQVLSGKCWIVDGDTIIINKTRIRLAGIDAPEMDHPYGKKAKWMLHALCKDQVVRAELTGDASHERVVATCYLEDGRDLSAEMVKAGYALDWPKFSGGKYRGLEAPDARKKLWRAAARQRGRMPHN